MSFHAQYSANLAMPIVRHLIAIIQRDQRAALDAVAGANVLGDIQSSDTGATTALQYPALRVYCESLTFDADSVGSLAHTGRYLVEICVHHKEPNEVAELIQQYALALLLILTQADITTLFHTTLAVRIFGIQIIQSIGIPSTSTVKRIFVASVGYSQTLLHAGGFVRGAQLQLIIEAEEA